MNPNIWSIPSILNILYFELKLANYVIFRTEAFCFKNNQVVEGPPAVCLAIPTWASGSRASESAGPSRPSPTTCPMDRRARGPPRPAHACPSPSPRSTCPACTSPPRTDTWGHVLMAPRVSSAPPPLPNPRIRPPRRDGVSLPLPPVC